MNKWCFILLVLLCSCRQNVPAGSSSEDSYDLNDKTYKAHCLADSLLSVLTLEERVGQCLMPSVKSVDDSVTVSDLKSYIRDFHIGGVVLMGGTLKSAMGLIKIAGESPVPMFVAIDAEWGLGMRFDDAPVYPKNGEISPATEENYLYDYGRKIASECKAAGINMVLGPVIDIYSERGGILKSRSYGDDPLTVSKFGVAYAKGLESSGVISVAKHFPGHGASRIDSHKSTALIERNISRMDSVDLKPFRDYINSGLSGIMAGHISSKALDPDGIPASVSMDMLNSLLREEMGFRGLIVTDAMDMGGARNYSAVQALKAGCDVILCPSDLKDEFQSIIKAVESGEIDVRIINDRCRRILFVKALHDI